MHQSCNSLAIAKHVRKPLHVAQMKVHTEPDAVHLEQAIIITIMVQTLLDEAILVSCILVSQV